MEYHPNKKIESMDNSALGVDEPHNLWRMLHFRFMELPEGTDVDQLSQKIYKMFENLPGHFYFSPRHGITVICKMSEIVILDDLGFRIKNMIKGDFVCRMGEQYVTDGGIVSLQFLFSPSSSEQQRLSQEFILQERLKRQHDIIMIVEDDLFSRNIVCNALKGKFKVVEIRDGAKATQEYLSHSPDVLFLDIHLPNKNGPQILKEILEVDPQAYVVMLSADAARDRVMECVHIGAKGFIAKPFKGEKLLDYIRKCPTIRVYC